MSYGALGNVGKSIYDMYDRIRTAPNDNALSRWLYADDWTKEKYDTYLALDSIYPVHLYMDYLLDKRRTGEYLYRYGMDYSDIHDPRNVPLSGSARALGSYGISMVSRNVSRLYR